MKLLVRILPSLTVFLLTGLESNANARSLRDRRAVSYIANQTVCVVDKVIYRDGDPIPTDDACESCRCRPPGFACVLRECEVKAGCKAIRREGQCCPEYQCGCEHNGRFFNDGDRIPNAESPCYSCYCQGSSITCALADCQFRFDCEPEYVPGECCPRYDHCPPDPTRSSTTTRPPTTLLSADSSPSPVFLPSSVAAAHASSTSLPTSSPDEDVTTSAPLVAVAGAEKQASSVPLPSDFGPTPDVTEASSSSLNQTSSAEAGTSSPEAQAAASTAVHVGVVALDEVAITISLADSKSDSVTTTPTSIDIAQEEYLTTKTWLPDSALRAEHRQQQQQPNGSAQATANHSLPPKTSQSRDDSPAVLLHPATDGTRLA